MVTLWSTNKECMCLAEGASENKFIEMLLHVVMRYPEGGKLVGHIYEDNFQFLWLRASMLVLGQNILISGHIFPKT